MKIWKQILGCASKVTVGNAAHMKVHAQVRELHARVVCAMLVERALGLRRARINLYS